VDVSKKVETYPLEEIGNTGLMREQGKKQDEGIFLRR
jgi:hypothetical protein